jgi:hypothetical protein
MMSTEMKLYSVTTTAHEYHGCRGVVFHWFRTKPRNEDRPYAELIQDYNDGDLYSKNLIDELFAEQEAIDLKEYLDRVHGDAGITTIEEQKLPTPSNMMGYGAMPVGGGDDFYMLHKDPEYSLPFGVEGYFDLVDCDLMDKPGEKFRHYLFLLSADRCRKETQEEARAREDTGRARNDQR